MSIQLKLFIDHPNYPSALVEFRCGSYDGAIQGLKIIGNSLNSSCPDLHCFPKLWHTLKGSERIQLVTLQKKACHILSSIIENPKIDQSSDIKLKNRLTNIEFLTSMSVEFGQTLTRKVYQSIHESIRDPLDLGDESFSQEDQAAFKKRLEQMQSKVLQQQIEFELPCAPNNALLPSINERAAYWESIEQVTRSKEGHMGVFYTHSRELSKDLVVKAPLRPVQECFASRIFQLLGFSTPDSSVVDRKSDEGRLIEKALEKSPEFLEHRKDVAFGKFLIMNRVYGRAFEEIDEAVAALAFKNDRKSLRNLLKQVGMVAAVDTLLHYQDRLPHIGCPNWGNLMCIEQNGRLTTSVAIDQSVDLSKPSVFLPAKTKLARIEQIADDVLTTPEKSSRAAEEIWEDIPAEIQAFITKEEALAILQKGMVAGFQKIASTITQKTLEEIDRSLSDLYTNDDFVVIGDLIVAQEIIAKRIQ